MDQTNVKNLIEESLRKTDSETVSVIFEREIPYSKAGSKQETFRVKRSYGPNGKLFVLAPRKRRMGWELGFFLDRNYKFVAIKQPANPKSEEQKWEDALRKIATRLRTSGFWPEVLEDVETALAVGLPKIKQAYRIQWEDPTTNKGTYYEMEKERARRIAEIDSRLIKNGHYNTGILWQFNWTPKVKKMRFEPSKRTNEMKLELIQKKIAENKEHVETGRTNYDVSFRFEPGTKVKPPRAWYSEEFKGCGNGHYYLALDGTHAIHWEDD